MNILILGSGGREAAMAWKLHGEGHRVWVAPGNGGMERWASNVPIYPISFPTNEAYFWALAGFAEGGHIDLVIVGPEILLEMGVVDFLRAQGLRVFGPTQAAAAIECSKSYGKEIAASRNIQTPTSWAFFNHSEALDYVRRASLPLMIKANDPISGERACIIRTFGEAAAVLERFMGDLGSSGVVIEQLVEGEEFSWHAVCDGKRAVHFPPAQDHSQLVPGGPFTGGVGVIVPAPWVTRDMRKNMRMLVDNTLAEMKVRGRPFGGMLYPAMKGLNLIEYNARPGDPEIEAYLRLLDSSLGNLLYSSADGDLGRADEVGWHSGYAASIAVVSGGYGRHGGQPEYGFPITGIEAAEEVLGVIVFPGAVQRDAHGVLFTDGNRVLHVTAIGDTLQQALDRAYEAVECIHFTGMDFSRTIGQSALMLQSAY